MYKSLLSILFLTFSFSVSAQTITNKDIGNLIVTQNFDSLATFFANEIVLNLNDIEENYGKEDAIEQLTVFFTENKPTKYSLEHEGNAGDNAAYGTGVLKAGDLVLDAQFFIRENKIIELCFEE